MGWESSTLAVVRESILIFESLDLENEDYQAEKMQGGRVPGRGYSRCKGSEAREDLIYGVRDRKWAHVTGPGELVALGEGKAEPCKSFVVSKLGGAFLFSTQVT